MQAKHLPQTVGETLYVELSVGSLVGRLSCSGHNFILLKPIN